MQIISLPFAGFRIHPSMSNIMMQEISKTQIESYSTINDRFSYNTSKILGKGASASVYLGYDKQQGQQIAVKYVPSSSTTSPGALSRENCKP
jgi:predicted Ser/Thr protein kinase